MAGAWGQMIGVACRNLDFTLMQEKTLLTEDVLGTVMAGVCKYECKPPCSGFCRPGLTLPAHTCHTSDTENIFPPPQGEFTDKYTHGSQWRQAQAIADRFWAHWKYMHYITGITQVDPMSSGSSKCGRCAFEE